MKVIDTALDVALIVMENGGSTFRADCTFKAILQGFNQEGVSVSWKLDSVTVFVTEAGQTSTFLRPIAPPGVNLSRVSAAWTLAVHVARGAIAVETIPTEIERIKKLSSPYRPWVIILTAALTAACYSQFIGGDWGSFGLTFVAGGIGQFVRLKLQARKLTTATVTLLCAILSALIGSVGLRSGISQVVPATLIGSVAYMIPGLPLVNGFIDLISDKHLSIGVERILNASFLFLVLTIGIAVAIAVVDVIVP